jgi:predicted phosphodiesterase
VSNGATAFIADIHGNVWALDAVLADIERRGIGRVFSLGDAVYGPLEPRLTAERLMGARIANLRGNQDRILLEPAPPECHPTLRYTLSTLLDRHLAWLRGHPFTIEDGDTLLCHGTPSSDEVYLLEAVNARGVWLRRADEIASMLGPVRQRVVACGHSHIPRVVELAGGRTIMNPGSVGLPAYSDDLPFPHCMETGSPHARYAVMEGGRVDLIAVAYDYRTAAARARENGREDWAAAIATGYAAP